MDYIKVLVPLDKRRSESCWVSVDKKTKQRCDERIEDGVIYTGVFANYSVFYPWLIPGVDVSFVIKEKGLHEMLIDENLRQEAIKECDAAFQKNDVDSQSEED